MIINLPMQDIDRLKTVTGINDDSDLENWIVKVAINYAEKEDTAYKNGLKDINDSLKTIIEKLDLMSIEGQPRDSVEEIERTLTFLVGKIAFAVS